jgi:serine/threonine protein kinase
MTLPDDDATQIAPSASEDVPADRVDTAEKSDSIDDEVTRIASPSATKDDDATRLNSSPAQQVITHAFDSVDSDNDATKMASQAANPVTEPLDSDATKLSTSLPSAAKEQAPQDFAPGTKIRDRFLLEKEIGRGGMGLVFTARDLLKEEVGDQDSMIAIKLLSDDFKTHPDALRMLQQETRKTQKLAHPNVVTVYDFDRAGDTVYMTMELLNGAPLTDFVKAHEQTTTELDEVLPIISDIVHGLDYAHQQGIIHSDLKPGNIFITDQQVTKIVDFGIARALMDSGTSRKNTSQTGSTKKGNGNNDSTQSDTDHLFALTPKYASPEMFDDAPPDPRDDIYALAIITYQLLAGRHPYAGLSANKAKQQGLEPERIESLSDRQWKGLCAGMAFERDVRTESAEQFLEAFLPKKKEPWRWATLSVGIIAAIITVYFMLQPPQEAPLSEQDQIIVNQQLEVAQQHMEVGNLANALESYKMILALPPYDKEPPGGGFIQHPYNSVATRELEQLLDQLQELAKQTIKQGNLYDANAFIEAGLSVDSEHAGLLKLKNQLESNK